MKQMELDSLGQSDNFLYLVVIWTCSWKLGIILLSTQGYLGIL